MKTRYLIALAVVSLLLSFSAGLAADTNSVSDDLKSLVGRVKTKLQDGKHTEAELANELKEFDALLAQHKDEKTDQVAQILFMKAQLYLEVFEDTDKGRELIQQVKRDFPKTEVGEAADKILAGLDRQEAAKKIRASLTPGAAFPEFSEKDVNGKPLAVADFKGKVVLVDFWATWCRPCVAELPNVIETYKKNHAQGFEIIGISLDEDKDKLLSFTKDKGMEWPQYFDGLAWQNKLAQKYGVMAIPATYLLDRQGKIIGTDLHGEQLDAAVAKALAAK